MALTCEAKVARYEIRERRCSFEDAHALNRSLTSHDATAHARTVSMGLSMMSALFKSKTSIASNLQSTGDSVLAWMAAERQQTKNR
eukprot:CAMPEP_0117568642 /NCGR_PEP_ID=MMETSP0784-20121206/58245_1 /TAXON_ID=39447 /ORGANISM="" /LENGTH=85 /DNA_ID=CAMNT_0005366585 /DNA_START=130 /DNA_END=383 /DNA_ORIENTATION=+